MVQLSQFSRDLDAFRGIGNRIVYTEGGLQVGDFVTMKKNIDGSALVFDIIDELQLVNAGNYHSDMKLKDMMRYGEYLLYDTRNIYVVNAEKRLLWYKSVNYDIIDLDIAYNSDVYVMVREPSTINNNRILLIDGVTGEQKKHGSFTFEAELNPKVYPDTDTDTRAYIKAPANEEEKYLAIFSGRATVDTYDKTALTRVDRITLETYNGTDPGFFYPTWNPNRREFTGIYEGLLVTFSIASNGELSVEQETGDKSYGKAFFFNYNGSKKIIYDLTSSSTYYIRKGFPTDSSKYSEENGLDWVRKTNVPPYADRLDVDTNGFFYIRGGSNSGLTSPSVFIFNVETGRLAHQHLLQYTDYSLSKSPTQAMTVKIIDSTNIYFRRYAFGYKIINDEKFTISLNK